MQTRFNAPKGGDAVLTESAPAFEYEGEQLGFNAPKGGDAVLTASPGGIIPLFSQMTPTGAGKNSCED